MTLTASQMWFWLIVAGVGVAAIAAIMVVAWLFQGGGKGVFW
jgi:hypothetical protein